MVRLLITFLVLAAPSGAWANACQTPRESAALAQQQMDLVGFPRVVIDMGSDVNKLSMVGSLKVSKAHKEPMTAFLRKWDLDDLLEATPVARLPQTMEMGDDGRVVVVGLDPANKAVEVLVENTIYRLVASGYRGKWEVRPALVKGINQLPEDFQLVRADSGRPLTSFEIAVQHHMVRLFSTDLPLKLLDPSSGLPVPGWVTFKHEGELKRIEITGHDPQTGWLDFTYEYVNYRMKGTVQTEYAPTGGYRSAPLRASQLSLTKGPGKWASEHYRDMPFKFEFPYFEGEATISFAKDGSSVNEFIIGNGVASERFMDMRTWKDVESGFDQSKMVQVTLGRRPVSGENVLAMVGVGKGLPTTTKTRLQNGREFEIALSDGDVRITDLDSGQVSYLLGPEEKGYLYAWISPDGRPMAVLPGGRLRVWDDLPIHEFSP